MTINRYRQWAVKGIIWCNCLPLFHSYICVRVPLKDEVHTYPLVHLRPSMTSGVEWGWRRGGSVEVEAQEVLEREHVGAVGVMWKDGVSVQHQPR